MKSARPKLISSTAVFDGSDVATQPTPHTEDATRPAPAALLPTWRALLRTVAELVCAMLVTGFVSLGLLLAINRLPIPRPSAIPAVVIMVGGGAAVVVIVALLVLRRWRKWCLPLSWAALAGLVTIPFAALLNGTKLYLGGLSVDQAFRTEYLTRLASSPALHDMAYKDLPPYYPAGWFWIGGRFAAIAGMPGWAAYKPFAIITVAVTTVVVFVLWKLSVSPRAALALAVMSTVLTMSATAHEPYTWFVGATVAPVAVLAWRQLSALAHTEKPSFAPTVAVGVALGIYGCFYTLFCAFAAFMLVLMGVIVVVRQRKRAEDEPSTKSVLIRTATHIVVLAAVAAVLLLVVWAPQLLALISGAQGRNLAAHFLPTSGAQFPMPFLQPSVSGVVTLVGLVWLALSVLRPGRYADAARGLAIAVTACYLWYLGSQLALLADTTLLAFRLEPLVTMLLASAATLAVFEGLQRFLPALTAHRQTSVVAGVAVLAAGVFIGSLQGLPDATKAEVQKAQSDYYPTGKAPSGVSSPADNRSWVPQLNDTIRQMTGRAPQDNVVLGGTETLLDTSPYWRFQAQTPQYANPLSGYDQRNDLILDWTHAKNSHDLAARLRASPVPAPSVFVLNSGPGGPSMKLSADAFPNSANVKFLTAKFDPAALHGPEFHTRTVGPYTVVTVATA
jgi:galactan 5-O-arabinofuranosyltransferase